VELREIESMEPSAAIAKELERVRAALDGRIAIHHAECGDFLPIDLDDAESVRDAVYSHSIYPAPYCTFLVLTGLRWCLEHIDDEMYSILLIDPLTILENHRELTTSEYDELLKEYGKDGADQRREGASFSAKFWADHFASWEDADRRVVHSWLVFVEKLDAERGGEDARLIKEVREVWDELVLKHR
jgi:hypothetical protein